MNIRINNIELRKLTNSNYVAEIVRWQKNSYYNSLDEFLNDGWIEENEYLKKENSWIQKTMFNDEFVCYVIAFIDKENCIRIIENRLFELNKKHQRDFRLVWNIYYKKYVL